MSELFEAVISSDEKTDLRQFVSDLRALGNKYLLRNDIVSAFAAYCTKYEKSQQFHQSSHLSKLIYYVQEIILEPGSLCVLLRPKIATMEIVRVGDDLTLERMTVQELLDVRDRYVNHFHPQEGDILELDFGPFYDYSPSIRDPKNIGKGVQFLNRYLSSKLFQDSKQWQETLFNFLRIHRYNGVQLLINDRIKSQEQLSEQVKKALTFVSELAEDEPYERFRFVLQMMGLDAGWGNTAARVQETLGILDELIDSPDPQTLEAFISRIPMIFKIVLVSPHGWFGQEGVLGRPDTGGQVVYVLDQAKNLEKQLQEDIHLAGLDSLGVKPKVIILTRLIPNSDGTRCNERLEKVHGTENAWILRVPFRDFNPKLTQNWISRFEIWPYLETYAIDAEKELLAEFQGKPDLIIGNKLKVTQCNIAHALEKSKYLFSNLYWQESEEKYHFALQFTADIIAMNAANCIVSSTYQEIVGKPDSVGQYESYNCFTMPDLYHVVNGIELFSPKFNVVPPGVNESVYFPYTRNEDRVQGDRDRLNELLFTLEDPEQVFGTLDDPQKRPLFSMARLDRIKNMTGLAELFGKSKELQEKCNLILVAGKLKVEETEDYEEAEEIKKLYAIIEQYNLHGKIRWLGVRLSKSLSGEIYRVIADGQGIFVQFYINPTNHEETAQKILDFLSKCEQNPNYWYEISTRGIDRVYSTYTWKIHTTKLLTLARTYGFWNYSSKENREDMLRYIEALFYLIYKPRAKALLEEHAQR
ncbi:MAG: sucrose synthase [Oscillatoriales cyanobacterium]|nr:MAG: sucrose synthase [Oscillatoriales cyanobacterium]